MDHSPPGSSVHGISQARILEWVAFHSSGDLPDLGFEHVSSALAGRFFTTEPPGKPPPKVWGAFTCSLEEITVLRGDAGMLHPIKKGA